MLHRFLATTHIADKGSKKVPLYHPLAYLRCRRWWQGVNDRHVRSVTALRRHNIEPCVVHSYVNWHRWTLDWNPQKWLLQPEEEQECYDLQEPQMLWPGSATMVFSAARLTSSRRICGHRDLWRLVLPHEKDANSVLLVFVRARCRLVDSISLTRCGQWEGILTEDLWLVDAR